MAEKILWIAKCKLRGMNQRVGVVYDDITMEVIAVRMAGPGNGNLSVKIDTPNNSIINTVRLGHKTDVDILSTKGLGIRIIKLDGFLSPDVRIGIVWSV